MTSNFLRVYNNGEIFMPQSLEEDEIINKNNILHYFNFADGCMFDRRYFFQIDYHKFNSRDGFPKYSSLNNIKFNEVKNSSTGTMSTYGFRNFKNTVYEVNGKVKVTYIKETDLNLVVKAGIMTGDKTHYEDWKGYVIGNTKSLQHEWHEFYGIVNTTTLDNTNFIAPWLSVVGQDDEISQNMYIEFKDVNMIPMNITMPDIKVNSKIRYVTLDIQGWVYPQNDVNMANFCNVIEIKALTPDGTNVALNKPVTTIPDSSLLNSGTDGLRIINDGDTLPSNYVCFDPFIHKEITNSYYRFTIDLENIYDIEKIEVYNYPNRKYSFSVKVGESLDKMICVFNNEFKNNLLKPLLINRETSCDLPHIVNIKNMMFNNSVDGYLSSHPEKTYTYNLSDFGDGARVVGDVKFLPYRNEMDFSINPPILTDYIVEMNPTETPNDKYISRFITDYISLRGFNTTEYNVEFSCWMFVEPGFNCFYAPLIKLEEYPEYNAPVAYYDMTKVGTWQLLKSVYKGKMSQNNITIESITPIIQGAWNQVWTKGKIYLTGISINMVKKIDYSTETGLIKPDYCVITPNIFKHDNFTVYIEFDMLNFDVNNYMTLFNDFGVYDIRFKLTVFANKTIEIRNQSNMFNTTNRVIKGKNKLAFCLHGRTMKLSLNGSDIESKICDWNIIEDMKYRFFNKSINESTIDNAEEFYNKICKLVVYDEAKSDVDLINMTKRQKIFKLKQDAFNQPIEESFLTKNIKNYLMNRGIIKYFPLSDDDKDLLSSSKLITNYTKYNFNFGRLYIGEHSNVLYKGDISNTEILEINTNTNLNHISLIFNYISTADNTSVDIWFGSRTEKQGLTNIRLKNTGLSSESIIKSFNAQGQKVFIQIKNSEVSIIDLMLSSGDNIVPGIASHTHNGLKINYEETMSVPMDSSFTLCYKVRVIKRQFNSVVEAIKPTGRITLFQLGSCDATPKFIFLGKPGARDGYPVMLYTNMRNERVKTYEGLTHDDWVTNEITVLVSYNATSDLFSFSILFENGKKIEDTVTLNSKIDTNSIKDNSYEFTIGSIRAIDQSMNFTISDLVMINGYIPLTNIKTLISPLSIGADGIRAGFQVNEKKKI